MATVVVQSRLSDGRRRAGRFWPSAPVEVDVDEATLAELRSDPQLVVRAPREAEHATPVSGDTVGSLRAELVEAREALAASRAAHEADMANCVSRATHEALRGELAMARALHTECFEDLAASRAAHAECDSRFTKAASLANDTVSKWSAAVAELEAVTAERDALRKQVAALEEAATAPTTTGKKK